MGISAKNYKNTSSQDRIKTLNYGTIETLQGDVVLSAGDVNVRVVKVFVNPDDETPLQYHDKRTEIWKVVSGDGIAIVDGKYIRLFKDEKYFILPGKLHKVWGGKEGLVIQQIWIGLDFDEDNGKVA